MKVPSRCCYCGDTLEMSESTSRRCTGCQEMNWRNPTPVAVCLLPVDEGLLLIRRAIEPGKGQLAFPGGFIEWNETWQQAATRELREETGINVAVEEMEAFSVLSSTIGDGVILIFGLAKQKSSLTLPTFHPTPETSELVIVGQPCSLAFPLHEEAMQQFFRSQ